MYDSAPEEYSQHLQIVGQEMLNGSLDKVGAVIRLVRLGWSHEEAHAAVNEIAEQVETTNKLIRDAARVLDDSPSGKARASARLREAGFSGNHAEQLVQHLTEHRQQSASRQRDMIQAIRRGKISRAEALEQLVSQGMDPIYANLKIDMATDSCTYWSAQWYKLTLVVAICAGMSVLAIASFLTQEIFDWIGLLLLALLACSSIVLYWAWQNHRFWQDWTLLHQSQRDCPRSCSPFVMLAENKGRQATVMTATEWGLPRMAATEL
ncbi:MAG TPA: hypothetical protein PKD72_14215, partial [Gemmatales bacterium]|nr:hypothetical protein [Gemmatales bacterium]